MQNSEIYRERLNRGFDLETVKKVTKEFTENKEIRLDCEFNWDHKIEGFHLNSKNELIINIYWQGDSRDGNDYINASEFNYSNKVVIPAETFFDGYRTRTIHSDIRVERSELDDAAKLLVEWLAPEKMAERAEYTRIHKVAYKIQNHFTKELIPELKENNPHAYNKNYFKMLRYIRKNIYELEKLKDEELDKLLIQEFLTLD